MTEGEPNALAIVGRSDEENRTIADPAGELLVSVAEDHVIAMLTPVDLIDYLPLGPTEVEQLIQILADRVERSAGVITRLYEDVHRATEKWQGAVADHCVANVKYGAQMARQVALSKTKSELHDLNLAKEKLKYAEVLADALQSKLYGYMNINKSVTAAYNASGMRR
ncbi:hypothetical protein [Cryobacterium sp. PH31-O1]|uniref:hypothetical protein n=1 Tax=Cryobacterium sp. PH31-O1 TaxID=3046306 RepID=UPI0024B9F31F|nr:hypothetical protein [Cryobacterium sp. PH31-O1]MDJ0337429.1 hypothetical protein [Cryobacterium sp. PH31-O1]